ncbi:hypothetical protein Q4489_08310 [Thalassotalea sp. 1_MG-2023]|uniref:CBU_0592 family membrane protein n=1 Tax=Thalassotalea sp. 1_MG-2023 TaxID=3062680 RepID=UPI0026E236A7|nr:hypothetical protein [Thalassotalea sp. 1_MG-2023]MDO6427010.1 hypothetical protein [Thalassotalea sp. 1_MG-2023]
MLVLIGWIGTVLYLINHAYISFVRHWKPNIYYGGNLLAAVVLVISSLAVSSYQAVFINAFWAMVSLAILRHWPINKIPASTRLFYLGLFVFVSYFCYQYIASGVINIALLGWSSAYAFTAGYLLFCCKKLNHLAYLLLNAYAAIVLLPQLWQDQNLPVFALEIAWAAISLVGAVKRVREPHLMD